MKPLAIVCPTRGRPEALRRMIESALVTSPAELLIYLDLDDPTIEDTMIATKGYTRTQRLVGPPIGRGNAINKLVEAFPEHRAYLIASDDITFTREGWEDDVTAAMNVFGDEIGCVHLASENGRPHVNWPCVSRRWINTLGWLHPPDFNRYFQDTVIQVLAESLGRITEITPMVVHHSVMQRDDAASDAQRDLVAFAYYMATRFGADLAKLRAAIA